MISANEARGISNSDNEYYDFCKHYFYPGSPLENCLEKEIINASRKGEKTIIFSIDKAIAETMGVVALLMFYKRKDLSSDLPKIYRGRTANYISRFLKEHGYSTERKEDAIIINWL